MKIIRSFTNEIGGELRIGRGDDGKGARFTVLFSGMATDAVAGMPNPAGTTAMSASSCLLPLVPVGAVAFGPSSIL
jgi:hypothetical protein